MDTLSHVFKTGIPAWGALIIIFYLSFTASAGAAETRQAQDWQTQRLMHPTEHQLDNEQHGHVFIYDGLSPQLIERAMDKSFDRIESMMFINSNNSKHRNNAKHSNTPQAAASSGETSDTDDGGCE